MHSQIRLNVLFVYWTSTFLSGLKDPPGFYLHPFDVVPASPDKPWYYKSRLGVNTLKIFLPQMSADAGLSVHYTNHSLRATSVTRMYNTRVQEKNDNR